MHGLPTEFQFTRERGAGFTFAHAAQQQHDLGRMQVLTLKDRATVQCIGALATAAPRDGELTPPGAAKLTRLVDARSTPRALEPVRMEILEQPSRADIVIQ